MLEIEQIKEILSNIRFDEKHYIKLYIFNEQHQKRIGIYCYDVRKMMVEEERLITEGYLLQLNREEITKRAVYNASISREECTCSYDIILLDSEKRIINELFKRYLTVHIGNMMKQIIYLKDARGLMYPDQLVMENLGKNLEKIQPSINNSEETDKET
jgi:hypothetical protein